MQTNIIYIDRSRIVTNQDCPRKRYWNYHHGGRGIERKSVALPLVSGIAVHQALEGLLIGNDPELVIRMAVATYAETVEERGIQQMLTPESWFLREQAWLLECVMRAWARHRLPKIREEYEVLAVEQEFTNMLVPGLAQMVRLDAILRSKETKGLEILEFKTVSMPGFDWQAQWERNVQILANTLAVEAGTGERCEGVKIEGLVLGQRRTENAVSSPFVGKRIRNSSYCYAWKSADAFGNPVYAREYKAGRAWKKVAIYDEEGMTPTQWIGDFTSDELDEVFQPLPAIRPVPIQMDRWKRQTIASEVRIAVALEELDLAEGDPLWQQRVLDSYFPQHDSACKRYGSPCPYEDACFDEGIGEDPVGSGLYQVRNPHHSTESGEE